MLTGNEIRETRGPAKRVGIRIGAAAGKVSLSNNTIEGFAQPLLDQRPA